MPYHPNRMPRLLRCLVVFLAVAAVLTARSSHGASAPEAARADPKTSSAPAMNLVPIASGLPDITSITNAGDRRLFITLQRGQIVIWDGAQILPTPFLDLSAQLICCGEQGLLSVAFPPNYAVNGFFFVNYTNLTGQTVVARYRVSSSDRNVADPLSAANLLTIDQPFTNHNGGQLQFGPDGDLYIGMGDGGSANDPLCNAQSTTSLLGKMLRIDVSQNVMQPPFYGIPFDNPYVRTTGPAEAWAYGLRNPWRFSFDRATGDLYIGDVGQDAREEVDRQPATSSGGENYGWKIMEGSLCGVGGTAGCTPPLPPCGDPYYTLPILEYSHENGNCAIVGGYVYRGTALPDLQGAYVYADYCSGSIWAATLVSGTWTTALLPIAIGSITTFGQDVGGELYVGTPGTLYQIQPPPPLPPTIASIAPASGTTRGGDRVAITGTNFTGQTGVAFGLAVSTDVTVQSSTLLIALSPPHPAGLVDVSVANPGSPPAVRQGAYGYLAVPRLSRPDIPPRVVTRP